MNGRTTRRRPAVGLALLLAAGCGGSGGPSDYEKLMQERQSASGGLAAAGAKVHEKQYPVGRAFVVELPGATVTDDLLRQVKALGNVAELDLSKSTVTDAHLATMHDIGLHLLLARLNLSNTAVTDAGLEKLDGCVFLMDLNLSGTKVTKEAVERFKKARQSDPKARVKATKVTL
jgi:hypothetical protein